MIYRQVSTPSFHAGSWRFYPEYMVAENSHNGAPAFFTQTAEGWSITVCNCPADWMLLELAEWFAKWLAGPK